ncbi:MAG: iron ABC transporter permease [Betaproteobacteria bacterium]
MPLRDPALPRIAALAIATALVAALALALGSGGLDWQLIVTLRAPRVAAAAGVGSLLALAGLGLQVLLRNPLADPYVLGHSSGASVGALVALLLGASLWIGAAAGALVAGLLLLWLARPALAVADDASPRLILLGAMLASIFSAFATLLLSLVPDERLRGAIFWIIGDLSGAEASLWNLAAAAVFVAWLWARGRSVDRLMLGADAAWLLGEPVRRLRLELLLLSSFAVGLAVATAGAIGFVGLVVAQGWRLAGVLRTRELAVLSAFSGAALLMAADLLARTVASPLELPVGAVMALIGAPCFIWFLSRGVK